MPLKKVYLELTNRCNLNCSICYRQSWSTKPLDMESSLLVRLQRELQELGSVEQVVLGGIGEPTHAALFPEALELFQAYRLTLTTNGINLSEPVLRSIVKFTELVMISIDGMEDNYSRIRGTALEQVRQNIKRINDLKEHTHRRTPVVGIQMVVSRDNMQDICQMIELASRLGVEILVLSNLLPQVREQSGKILYTRNENKEVKSFFNKAVNYSFLKGVRLTLPHWELKTERRCSFVEEDTTFITAAGEIVPCYRLSHTYKEFVLGREKTVLQHSFGSLGREPLVSIWESREYREFRERVYANRYPSCLDCDYVDGCDLVSDTSGDCYTGGPSCSDCLWARKIILCP